MDVTRVWSVQNMDRGIQLAMHLIAQQKGIPLGREMPVHVKLRRERDAARRSATNVRR